MSHGLYGPPAVSKAEPRDANVTRVWVLVAWLSAGAALAQAPQPQSQPPQQKVRTVKEVQAEGREIVELLQGQLKDIEARYNEAKNNNNATKQTCLEEPRTSMRGVVRSAEDLNRELESIVLIDPAAEKLGAIRIARDQAKKIKESVETCEVKSGSGGDQNGTMQVTEPGDLNTAPQPNQGSSGTMPSVNTPPASPT